MARARERIRGPGGLKVQHESPGDPDLGLRKTVGDATMANHACFHHETGPKRKRENNLGAIPCLRLGVIISRIFRPRRRSPIRIG